MFGWVFLPSFLPVLPILPSCNSSGTGGWHRDACGGGERAKRGSGSVTCTVTVEHEYVVIGGLKWATCNIGAEKPTDYGWYFSWGNTQGYTHDGSKWVKPGTTTPLAPDGSFSGDNYRSVDYSGNGRTLSTDIPVANGYDAAKTNWGDKWRMPTKEEFQKLYDVCGGTTPPKTGGSTATVQKGVYWCSDYNDSQKWGLLFCDGKGALLFFPAAGLGSNTGFHDSGNFVYYWSSSLDMDHTDEAYQLYCIQYNINPQRSKYRYQRLPRASRFR